MWFKHRENTQKHAGQFPVVLQRVQRDRNEPVKERHSLPFILYVLSFKLNMGGFICL